MEVSDADRKTLNILRGNLEDYPKMYHIRGGHDILVEVKAATEETITGSFKEVEGLYVKEMKAFQKHLKEQQDALDNEDDSDDEPQPKLQSKTQPKPQPKTQPKPQPKPQPRSQPKNQSKSQPIQFKNITTKQVRQPDDSDDILIQDQDERIDVDMDRNYNEPDQQQDCQQDNQDCQPQSGVDPVLEKKKNVEKLVFLNKKCDELRLNMVKDIAKRKKMEAVIEKKKAAEKKNDDGKEYRKNLRKQAK